MRSLVIDIFLSNESKESLHVPSAAGVVKKPEETSLSSRFNSRALVHRPRHRGLLVGLGKGRANGSGWGIAVSGDRGTTGARNTTLWTQLFWEKKRSPCANTDELYYVKRNQLILNVSENSFLCKFYFTFEYLCNPTSISVFHPLTPPPQEVITFCSTRPYNNPTDMPGLTTYVSFYVFGAKAWLSYSRF